MPSFLLNGVKGVVISEREGVDHYIYNRLRIDSDLIIDKDVGSNEFLVILRLQ